MFRFAFFAFLRSANFTEFKRDNLLFIFSERLNSSIIEYISKSVFQLPVEVSRSLVQLVSSEFFASHSVSLYHFSLRTLFNFRLSPLVDLQVSSFSHSAKEKNTNLKIFAFWKDQSDKNKNSKLSDFCLFIKFHSTFYLTPFFPDTEFTFYSMLD